MEKKINTFLEEYKDITDYYNYLVELTKNFKYVGITNEWLIDNYYILAEYKNMVTTDKKYYNKILKNKDKVYDILKTIVEKDNYNINFKDMAKSINEYQKNNKYYLSYREIEVILVDLIFIYISRLHQLVEQEYQKIIIKDEVEKLIENKDLSKFSIKDVLNNSSYKTNNTYIFEINNSLREYGSKSNKVFKEFNDLLEKENITLREVLNDEYQNRIDNSSLITNLFNNLKSFTEVSSEDLYENISKCEKYLLKDIIYSNMTIETKNLYREKIIKNAKKKKIDEYSYIKNLYDTKTDEVYHIGFLLFKAKNNKFKVFSYLSFILIVTILLSLYLTNYFLDNKILGFIILFIPTMELIKQITNYFLTVIVPTKPLPKMNYTKKIPDESATMVVIPTIIKDTKKIKEMFDMLETYYLVNKTPNLYFSLLADTSEASEAVLKIDKTIVKYGVEYSEALNKKYKKDLFFFVYRKRFYNKSEDSYLGYERKRGAILQFNRLLLHKYSTEEINKYFNVTTLDKLESKIKYVITLDTDTKLVLNTALNLVGAMAHPLNKPVINKSLRKVESGYAIMQPRVSTDIEATNKSIYSQIFAGVGGFDTYSAIVPNVFQDSFGEGSFIGKGIYDLEVFDYILYNRFKDNYILSHDLLEGNYLKCAYVSDVEVIDDFPASFLVDITRIHRWARGDSQIISFLKNFITNKNNKKERNVINLLGRYKILDNILRMFLYPSLLLILILPIFFGKVNYIFYLLFALLVISLPILFYLRSKLYKKGEKLLTVYYKNIMFGSKSILLRTYIVLATIPIYTKLYMSAFFMSIYRLTISHKHLLNWLTAEDASKNLKDDLLSYIKTFTFSNVFATILLLVSCYYLNFYTITLAFIFLSAPFVCYYVSKDITKNSERLSKSEEENVLHIAYRTWMFFKDNLKEEYNYLIPDNYEEKRETKLDFRTSPTDIGFSLTSVVSAYTLKFITLSEAKDLITKIIDSVISLDKWNGHLYNWYDIKTKKALPNYFVSSIDSGNLVACLIVVKEFLEKNNYHELALKVNKLINNTNFKKLYTKKDVFSIGYDAVDAKLSIYNYNKFASESRLTSFIAISKGEVPSKHWFCLDKTLTSYMHHKGLISWSGTSFEYFMPYLFMKNYPNTLLDETYKFAHLCQKSYIESVKYSLPWGISESAYSELDNALNYKYYAFSTPYLKAKEDKDNRVVISPYSSLMALDLFPKDVYNNMKKLKNLNMYGKYGFYEAYDYDNKAIVLAYFTHHQGMCLMGLTNYLKDNALKNYFHSDVDIKTFEILLKEKVQIKTNIDIKMAKYKKYDYKKESIENDIRSFNYINEMPEVSVLSNKKFTLLINDRGNSFSRYRTLQLNRYRKITEIDYGMFLYIKDLDTNDVWSNTYAPINKKSDKYEVVFASDAIKFVKNDYGITTKTEIIVTKNHNASIYKITFKNETDKVRNLQLTTYTECVLAENMDDISHKVFSNLFIESSYDKDTNSLIAKRKPRNSNVFNYMINRLLIDDPSSVYTYETDRFNFIGRNHTVSNPVMLDSELSNIVGTSIDPIMSIRNNITIDEFDTKEVYIISGFARSREALLDIVKAYNSKRKIKQAFNVSALMNVSDTKKLNITGKDMRIFNIMLNYLYQTTKININKEKALLLSQNSLKQSTLWKYGISGDIPIITTIINDINDLAFAMDILKCFEYYKNKSIFVDMVIINSDNSQFSSFIEKEIEDELYRMYTSNNFYHTKGIVKVINKSSMSDEEIILFEVASRLFFTINNNESLEEKINNLQRINTISKYEKEKYQQTLELEIPKLTCYNTYGGFKNKGSEYQIVNKDTPTPWSNVISNLVDFGTIITNNGNGFTYAYNSNEFKLTSWTNEMVVNDKSEGIKINGLVFDPTFCTHGFGYTNFKSETIEFEEELIEFVALEEKVKIFIFNIKNVTNKKQDIDIEFFINPTLGNFEEKTARYILTELDTDNNYLSLRNVYNNYNDVLVYMASSEVITNSTSDKVLIKAIGNKISLDKESNATIIFTLGCGKDLNENIKVMKKYQDKNNVLNELERVKNYFSNTLNTINVKTNDTSFNYMMNGWLLYQCLSSRIMAKAGFYQVSGAFGFRDQLQDAMNIVTIKPDYTKKQILTNAAHQFILGDVLHWWHDESSFGLRSRYKDDYVWLVYATIRYLEVTRDFSILDIEVPFITAPNLSNYETELGVTFTTTNTSKTLLEHCLLSLDYSMSQMGVHNLSLFGGGDWNDGMNKVGIKGRGESIWLSMFLYNTIDKFLNIMKYNRKIDKDKYLKFNKSLKEAINTNGFDKTYYLRGYFDNGDKLGSINNEECKIDLISQSFAIISDIVPDKQRDKVLAEVEKYLVDKDLKIVKLLTPAFNKSIDDPGYIMKYPEGIRENGGQYTHAVSWYIMALIKAGRNNTAYDIFQMINPIERSKKESDVLKYKLEPYVIAADIYSNERYKGRGGWSFYTGSAGWFYKVGLEDILGFIKEGDTLKIKPHLPSKIKNYHLEYKYMDTLYIIDVATLDKEYIEVDKNKLNGDEIFLINDKKIHKVNVYIKGVEND